MLREYDRSTAGPLKALILVALMGCGTSGQDPNSPQLVSIHHQIGSPTGALAVDSDGSYAVLDDANEVQGQLTAEELSGVETHAGASAMARLMAGRVSDERCSNDAAAYLVLTQHGNACLALDALTDPAAADDLGFLIDLFASKAAH